MKNPNKMTVTSYDKMAKAYAWKNKRIAPSEERELFISMLPKDAKILDAGCGYGRDAIYFSDLGFDVAAVDPSIGLINEAKKDKSRVEFIVSDLINLNFPAKTFDGIWCNAVLHHLDDDEYGHALNNFTKILKDDGVLYILNRIQPEGKNKLTKEGPDETARYFYYKTAEQNKEMLTQHHFTVIKEVIFNKRERYGQDHEDVDVQCLYLRKK